MGFNLIYWTPMGGSYFLLGSNLEKFWKILEKRPFFRADMAGLGKYHGLGSIGKGTTRQHYSGKMSQHFQIWKNNRNTTSYTN